MRIEKDGRRDAYYWQDQQLGFASELQRQLDAVTPGQSSDQSDASDEEQAKQQQILKDLNGFASFSDRYPDLGLALGAGRGVNPL